MAAARSIKPGWTPQALLTWRPKGDKPEKKHLWAACKERNPALKENQLRDKQGMVDWLSLNGAPSDADRSGETSVFVMEINLDGNFFYVSAPVRRACALRALLSARCSDRSIRMYRTFTSPPSTTFIFCALQELTGSVWCRPRRRARTRSTTPPTTRCPGRIPATRARTRTGTPLAPAPMGMRPGAWTRSRGRRVRQRTSPRSAEQAACPKQPRPPHPLRRPRLRPHRRHRRRRPPPPPPPPRPPPRRRRRPGGPGRGRPKPTRRGS